MVSILFNSSSAAMSRPVRGLGGWMTGWVGRLIHGLIRWRDHRAAIKALHQLDDRELRDIGLTRDRIEDAVCGITQAEAELGRFG